MEKQETRPAPDPTAGTAAPTPTASPATAADPVSDRSTVPAPSTVQQAVPAPSTAPTAAALPTPDERRQRVFDFLDAHGIRYTWYEHPEAPTIEIARRYWHNDGSKHCKNLFFRNHKGDRHYLVSFDCEQSLAIHDLEHRLRQGKLSFASEQRMARWLGLRPGSVSPFGLINDPTHHVHLFLDRQLLAWPPCRSIPTTTAPRWSFHARSSYATSRPWATATN